MRASEEGDFPAILAKQNTATFMRAAGHADVPPIAHEERVGSVENGERYVTRAEPPLTHPQFEMSA